MLLNALQLMKSVCSVTQLKQQAGERVRSLSFQVNIPSTPRVFFQFLHLIESKSNPRSLVCLKLYNINSLFFLLQDRKKCELIKCKFNAHNMPDLLIYGEICPAAAMGRNKGMHTCLSCENIELILAAKQQQTPQI